jgi:GNAT superfamily N-acetyltransferase
VSEAPEEAAGVTCRLATTADRAAVADLFHLCDRHYMGDKAPSPERIADYVRTQVLTPDPTVEILLAEADRRAIGFASFALLYPGPNLGAQLYMKDLFVPEAARSRGVGLSLLRALAKIAVARGCSRLDWTAEDHNPRALAFYDRIGARRVTEKVYFRFDGETLKDFAEGT